MTTKFRAQFDGKALIPLEPVDLPTGQVLEIEANESDAGRAGSPQAILRVMHGLPPIPSEASVPGRKRTEQQAAAYFPVAPARPVPVTASEHYASLKFACKRNGVSLNENDLWIAATALALDATLVTRDKDFSRVSGLTVEVHLTTA